MISLIRFIAEKILDIIFPTFCCECGVLGQYLCKNCIEKISFYTDSLQLASKKDFPLENLHLASATAATHYKGSIVPVLHALKYQSVKGIAKYLAHLVYFSISLPKADLVTCVPVHKHRQQERGFNQAEEIAKKLAKLMKLPYAPLLTKTLSTSSQAAVSNKEKRLRNLKNAFQISQPSQKVLPKLITKYPTILLVDDVITTGTTLNTCAQVLRSAGFLTIHGLAVAHG